MQPLLSESSGFRRLRKLSTCRAQCECRSFRQVPGSVCPQERGQSCDGKPRLSQPSGSLQAVKLDLILQPLMEEHA